MSRFYKSTLAILLFAILLGLGSIFWFKENETRRIENMFQESKEPSNSELPIEPSEAREENSSEEEVSSVTPSATTTAKKVTVENCEQECEGFSVIPSEQTYCLSYCGLGQEKYQNNDCEKLTQSEKDFCFKEKALQERNPETCARIGESSLRKVCEARLAEELFD
jgi:hypothetical protein